MLATVNSARLENIILQAEVCETSFMYLSKYQHVFCRIMFLEA